MRDYAILCDIMQYYANRLNFMLASHASARHLFMRARIRKAMRRRLWFYTFYKKVFIGNPVVVVDPCNRSLISEVIA